MEIFIQKLQVFLYQTQAIKLQVKITDFIHFVNSVN